MRLEAEQQRPPKLSRFNPRRGGSTPELPLSQDCTTPELPLSQSTTLVIEDDDDDETVPPTTQGEKPEVSNKPFPLDPKMEAFLKINRDYSGEAVLVVCRKQGPLVRAVVLDSDHSYIN